LHKLFCEKGVACYVFRMRSDIKKVALYIRVSTLDQSTDMQRDDLIEYCVKRGLEVYKIYEDKASGTTSNRPALNDLLSDAHQRKYDTVLCWKIDRFFRSLRDLINTLQLLEQLGIEFISFKDHNFDTTTEHGRLMMHIIAALSEYEVALLKVRVRAGLEHAKRKGIKLGRPKINKGGDIQKLRKEGDSIRMIAKKLGVSVGTVHRSILRCSKNHLE